MRHNATNAGAGDPTQQEAALPQPDGPGTLYRRHHAHQQAHRADREHRGSHAADAAQRQQLPIALRQAGEQAADRHDGDAGAEHDPLPDAVDQPAGREGAGDAHERKGADDGRRLGLADVERGREKRQVRGNDPEAERHEERHHHQDAHLPGEPGRGRRRHKVIIALPQRKDLLSAASNQRLMRRWLRLLAAALLAAGAAMLLLPGGTAAAAATKVGVVQQSWFWQNAYEQANPPVAQTLPATEPSGVPEGDLAVAYTGNADKSSSKMTALSFDMSTVPAGATIDAFTFSLPVDPAPSATSFDAQSAAVVACPPTRSWPAVLGGDYTDQPTVGCAHKVAPTVSGSTYTFKIPTLAQTWVDDQNLGVAIVADPDSAAAPFQLVFAGAKNLKADLSYSPPVTSSGSSAGSSTGSGSVVVPAAGGNTGAGSGPVNVSVPPATTTDPGNAPVVAASAAPAAPALSPVAAAKTAPSIPTKAFWAAALVLGALLLIASLVLGDPTPVAPAASGSRLDQVLRSRRTATETP